jgi:hypothetical protein
MAIINKFQIVCWGLLCFFINIDITYAAQDSDYAVFCQALENKSNEEAARMGEILFEKIENKYHANGGFIALKSKMTAAEYLTNQMIAQIKKATDRQLSSAAGNLFGDDKGKNILLNLAPAKSYYESSMTVFSKSININDLENTEKEFLAILYNLKMKILINSIALAGQALSIAEPEFQGAYDYVLVLPLLHASESIPVKIDVFPKWMRQSQYLDIFSDSCLLHYGFVQHAETFAKQSAEMEQKDYSEGKYYTYAAKKCKKRYPRIAVDCLERAIALIGDNNTEDKVNLEFDVIQIWLDSENYILAANEANKIIDNFPEHKRYGNAVWLYYYALSRANNAESILANIDSAITDSKNFDYKVKLLYLKWWALRKQRNQIALITALEHQLITDYGNDEIVAPIMLSQATDRLAAQNYAEALTILEQLKNKFPSTKAAQQAVKIADKLKDMQGSK